MNQRNIFILITKVETFPHSTIQEILMHPVLTHQLFPITIITIMLLIIVFFQSNPNSVRTDPMSTIHESESYNHCSQSSISYEDIRELFVCLIISKRLNCKKHFYYKRNDYWFALKELTIQHNRFTVTKSYSFDRNFNFIF